MIFVEMPDGSEYRVSKLLTAPAGEVKLTEEYAKKHPGWYQWWTNRGSLGGNTKQAKGKAFKSVGLSLAPNRESGYSVCPNTTPGCTRACLFNGGISGAFSQIKPSQIAKTRALFQHRKEFDKMLMNELQAARRKYAELLVCRLNVYSDLPWERMTPWVFEEFHDVQFYDYTKVVDRYQLFLDGKMPKNYHLTFSRSEMNEPDVARFLMTGRANVAVVFPEDQFPETYRNTKVINGDESDLRFLDPTPCVVGLKAKNVYGRHDQTGFVVRKSLTVIESGSNDNVPGSN